MMVHWAVLVALNLACQSEGLQPVGVNTFYFLPLSHFIKFLVLV